MKTSKLLDEHFEEQRIHDLKIDIDTIVDEVGTSYDKACTGEAYPDCAGCRMKHLHDDLNWFKTLL